MSKLKKRLANALYLLLAIGIVYNMLFFGVIIEGDSMNPTLLDKQVTLASKLKHNIDIGSIVIIQREDFAVGSIVKRVMAKEGDSIKFENGRVYINGIFQGETKTEDLDLIVPKDKYFVLGDNRSNSYDSRETSVGFISNKEIKGVVMFDKSRVLYQRR